MSNQTSSSDAASSVLLDTFIPGYPQIREHILLHYKLDINLIVTLVLIAYGFKEWVWPWLWENVISKCFTQTIILEDDELYWSLLEWAAKSELPKKVRTISAVTPWQSLRKIAKDLGTSAVSKQNPNDENSKIFNFTSVYAEIPLLDELWYGNHWVWEGWHLLRITMWNRSSSETSAQLGEHDARKGWTVRCFGRSRQPITIFLERVRKEDARETSELTFVRRPSPWGSWVRATNRTQRSMQTIIMDQDEKVKLLRDANNFIWPQSSNWYSARGLPHRRGYLLSGPPGTGKTSLSFALAGLFGLSLYVVSLSDKEICDSTLLNLFCRLPDRCIVLLEDVDAAGLKRKKAKDKSEPTPGLKETLKEILSDECGGSKVTLSGLLNAIDGVATHEGRIVAMTTNRPDDLDSALTRPGRIDKHVKFTLSTPAQASEIFLAMYSSEEQRSIKTLTGAIGSSCTHCDNVNNHLEPTEPDFQSLAKACREIKDSTDRRSDVVGVDMHQLRQLSQQFASKIPMSAFTAAEIQNFLLLEERLHDPKKALTDADAWAKKRKEKMAKEEAEEKAKAKAKRMKRTIAKIRALWSRDVAF